ncbi:MAG: tetratricopeptide repeat protein, partial [Chitinivibrionales bacterium]|nr:tetratricopeptide repeat protein [Chitinivibrionales bacterium]
MATAQPSIQHYEEKLAATPNSLIFARLADAYRQRGDIPQAIELCQSGLEHHPEYVTGRIILGRCFLEQENLEEALLEFSRICHLDRKNPMALKMLAQIYAKKGLDEKAGDLYTLLVRLDPENQSMAKLAADYQGSGKTNIYEIIDQVNAPQPKAPPEPAPPTAQPAEQEEASFEAESASVEMSDEQPDMAAAALTEPYEPAEELEPLDYGEATQPETSEADVEQLLIPESDGNYQVEEVVEDLSPTPEDENVADDIGNRMNMMFAEEEAAATQQREREWAALETQQPAPPQAPAPERQQPEDTPPQTQKPQQETPARRADDEIASRIEMLFADERDDSQPSKTPAPGTSDPEAAASKTPPHQPEAPIRPDPTTLGALLTPDISGEDVSTRINEIFGEDADDAFAGPFAGEDADRAVADEKAEPAEDVVSQDMIDTPQDDNLPADAAAAPAHEQSQTAAGKLDTGDQEYAPQAGIEPGQGTPPDQQSASAEIPQEEPAEDIEISPQSPELTPDAFAATHVIDTAGDDLQWAAESAEKDDDALPQPQDNASPAPEESGAEHSDQDDIFIDHPAPQAHETVPDTITPEEKPAGPDAIEGELPVMEDEEDSSVPDPSLFGETIALDRSILAEAGPPEDTGVDVDSAASDDDSSQSLLETHVDIHPEEYGLAKKPPTDEPSGADDDNLTVATDEDELASVSEVDAATHVDTTLKNVGITDEEARELEETKAVEKMELSNEEISSRMAEIFDDSGSNTDIQKHGEQPAPDSSQELPKMDTVELDEDDLSRATDIIAPGDDETIELDEISLESELQSEFAVRGLSPQDTDKNETESASVDTTDEEAAIAGTAAAMEAPQPDSPFSVDGEVESMAVSDETTEIDTGLLNQRVDVEKI